MFKKIAEFFTGKKPDATPEVPYKVEATNNAETTFKYEDVKPAAVELTPVVDYADIAIAQRPAPVAEAQPAKAKPAAKKKAPAAKKPAGAKKGGRKPKSQA